jgi:hypothetical protein
VVSFTSRTLVILALETKNDYINVLHSYLRLYDGVKPGGVPLSLKEVRKYWK